MPISSAIRFVLPTCALLLATGAGAGHAAKHTPPPPASAASPATAEERALHAAWVKAEYRFTPEVRAAYLAFSKAQALSTLGAAHQTLPADFLAWVDSDPVVAGTVYGSAQPAAGILRMLRSLDLDLGQDVVRKQYTQLALAMAVVHADQGATANLAARAPLTLVIPPNPLKPVNTRDPNRTLDVNDHIINFLNDHPVEEKPKRRTRTVAVKNPDPTQALETEVPDLDAPEETEKHTRPLTGAEVMASKELQAQFNAYMKEKGQQVEIDCETPRRSFIPDKDVGAIFKASGVFRAAYVAKGLLPAKRDAAPSIAETCAFLIRNDQYRFPAGSQRVWPRFPLTAPWPTLVYLAQIRQPLRECEDMWERYRDTGEIHTYGHYVGNIAHHPTLLAARSMAPCDFGYESFQMMVKDGGVCGIMSTLNTYNKLALGVPACTASQPGHCALVAFHGDPKTGAYKLTGEQFATGGVMNTKPLSPWVFDGENRGHDMIDHQAMASAVSLSLPSYLDSMQARQLLRRLSPADRQAHGLALAESGITLNPYNPALNASAQELAATPGAKFHLLQTLKSAFAATASKPGCQDSLYSRSLQARMMDSLMKLPLPTDREEIKAISAGLEQAHCDNAQLRLKYQIPLLGLPAIREQVAADLKASVAGNRTPESCAALADRIEAVGQAIGDEKDRQAFAQGLLPTILGHETFTPADARKKAKPKQDPCAAVLLKLAGKAEEPAPRAGRRKKAAGQKAGPVLPKPETPEEN